MGLIRGVARTAAIAGTATVVSNRVSRRQANKWAEKDQQQADAAGRRAAAGCLPQQQAYARRPLRHRLRHRGIRHAHPASATWGAQGGRCADRGGIRCTEGEDSRQLTQHAACRSESSKPPLVRQRLPRTWPTHQSRRVRDVKPFLLLGIRADDVAADDEYAAMLRFSGLNEGQLRRVRIEQSAARHRRS